jgi:hypothetical protein
MSLPSSSHRLLSDDDVYRTLVSGTLTLSQLCRRGDWHRVMQRIHRHPHEVVDECLLHAVRATGYQTSTLLSVPIYHALLQINPRQIQIIHPLTGTIVHEAIQYWCPNTIIDYLLEAIVLSTFGSKNLLDVQDDIGRTMLHCMVGRWQRFHVSQISSPKVTTISDVELFSRMHRANPRQARVRDIDGYTPLLLILQTPPSEESDASPQETELLQIRTSYTWREKHRTINSRGEIHWPKIPARRGSTFIPPCFMPYSMDDPMRPYNCYWTPIGLFVKNRRPMPRFNCLNIKKSRSTWRLRRMPRRQLSNC